MVEFPFSQEVDHLIMGSWTCPVKLGLRPSFLSYGVFLVEFLFSLKVDDLS